jgi:hypothetical protein
VFGATRNGTIHAWDTRGGRASAAFQSHNEVHSADKYFASSASFYYDLLFVNFIYAVPRSFYRFTHALSGRASQLLQVVQATSSL